LVTNHCCSTAWVYSFDVPPADGKKVFFWHSHASNKFNAAPAASFNLEHEIASFRGSGPQKLAIAKGRCPEKSNPAEALNGSSRATR
jgi:hypothetical protein